MRARRGGFYIGKNYTRVRTLGSVSVRTLTAVRRTGETGGPSETRSDRLAVRLNVGKRDACYYVRRRVSAGPPVSPALPATLGPQRRAAKDSRGIDRRSRPNASQRVVGRLGARNLFRSRTRTSIRA